MAGAGHGMERSRALSYHADGAVALLEMSVCHFVALVLPQRLMQGVTRICADLTKIYIAQWIIIIWVVRAVMTEYLGLRLDM